MARGKDLAGLAALGALGMMLSKGKKTEVEDRFGPGEGTAYGKQYKGRDRSSPSPRADVAKEVPFRGMPVNSSDALPAYLAKQANNPEAKPNITDEYTSDRSPAYKKNEFGEVYMATPEKQLKEYQDRRDLINKNVNNPGYSAGMKKGGAVKKMASGGMASSASKRADGIAQKGKTKGRMC